jgi:molybdate transport system substrate-binding protein
VLGGLLVLALSSALGPACSGSGDHRDDRITVLAAASLTELFEDLAPRFEERRGITVELSFAGSNVLATQIREGAPADVFASANDEIMAQLTAAVDTGDPIVFTRNTPVLIAPADNPAGVESLHDLDRADVVLALCDPGAPCGDLADRWLGGAGVEPGLITREADVKAVVAKVAADEVDAGIVYRSDVVAAGSDLVAIARPATRDLVTDYPMAIIGDAPPAARQFVDFVVTCREALAAHGFTPVSVGPIPDSAGERPGTVSC